MIKVNLLTNRVEGGGNDQSQIQGPSGGGGGGAGTEAARDALVKGAALGLFTIGMMLYESQTIRALNEERARVASQEAMLQKEATAKTAEAEKFKDVEVQAKELEDKLKILKLLSKLRLREVKTLDFMQSSVPEKVWLKSVQYESDKLHVEAGKFKFFGSAVTTDDLTEFVRRLEGGSYLQDIIVVKNQEVTLNKILLRDFLFTANVENKDPEHKDTERKN